MNLKTYIDNLIKFSGENKERLKMMVVASICVDDNNYIEVKNKPSEGNMNAPEFQLKVNCEDNEPMNAVCVSFNN